MLSSAAKWTAADRLRIAIGLPATLGGFVSSFLEKNSMMVSLVVALGIYVFLSQIVDRHPWLKMKAMDVLGGETKSEDTLASAKSVALSPALDDVVVSSAPDGDRPRPPHAAHLPVWLAMRDVLAGNQKEIDAIDLRQLELTKAIQAAFDALAVDPNGNVPELSRRLSEWHGNALSAQAIADHAFADHDTLGLRSLIRTSTPFDLEAKLPETHRQDYHRFRDHVNLWNERMPLVRAKFSKEIKLHQGAIIDEVRRLTEDAKRQNRS